MSVGHVVDGVLHSSKWSVTSRSSGGGGSGGSGLLKGNTTSGNTNGAHSCVIDDFLGHGSGLSDVLSNVLLNTLNERSGYLTVNNRLNLFNDSGLNGLLNDGSVGNNIGAS